jgi:integrase
VPFFQTKTLQLHEIQYDILMQLLTTIKRAGKGKQNVMFCLHACLDYAWKARRILAIPPFPNKKKYNIIEPTIEWLPSDRQRAVIEAIPLEHQPIFWFLKYHLRRPGEAMALYKEDLVDGVFHIHRGFSARQNIERTKTGEIHLIDMVDEFAKYLEIEHEKQRKHGIISPYLFVYPDGKKEGKHYTDTTINTLWHTAREIIGETIRLYSGTKHSSCCQYINEEGYSIHQVQVMTDHAQLESVKKYAKTEGSTRKALMEKKIIRLPGPGTFLARTKGDKD